VETGQTMNSRLVFWLALFAALVAGFVALPVRADADPDPSAFEIAPEDFEARIEALVERWFGLLEDPGAEATRLSDLLGEAPLELKLEGETLRDRAALIAWVSRFRANHPQVEHRLDSIRVEPEGQDRYRVRFAFDRHAFDDAGLAHVARREQRWIVLGGANAPPVISRIEERPLLFFGGTGPQIVCY